MKPSTIYIIVITIVFAALAAIFLLLPRSTYSELEKRDLATFPEFSVDKLQGAQYTTAISQWFSDTEPYRDDFMAASMKVRDKIRMSFGAEEDNVTFHATDSPAAQVAAGGSDINDQEDYQNKITADENAKIASAGILIIGKAPNVRALNAFGGEATGGTAFASVVSDYAAKLPGVKVYAMVIPLSVEFYMPEKAKGKSKPQLPFIKNIYSHLANGARGVNAYGALASHVAEDIYLRTDHHWSPLGAYYAAKEFAAAAGVPFKDLSTYEKRVVHGFVGSMYGYSKDMSVKESPEDFVYYLPKGVNYTTTYRNYSVNKDYQVTKEGNPVAGEYFIHYKDGSGMAYSTFMGGDQKLTHIHTGANTGRRLIVIKDSYGNALPGYLFHSFDDIHIVDFRYFTHNIKKYAADNKITDVVFCVNVFNAYASSAAEKMRKFLTQGENNFAPVTPVGPTDGGAKSNKDGKPKQEPAQKPAPAVESHEEKAPEAPASTKSSEGASEI